MKKYQLVLKNIIFEILMFENIQFELMEEIDEQIKKNKMKMIRTKLPIEEF